MRRLVAVLPALVILIGAGLLLALVPVIVRSATFARTEAEVLLTRQATDSDDILARLNAAVRNVARSVAPSVVHIDIVGGEAGGGSGLSSGSGWVFDERGHIVTNAHVVRKAERIRVQFEDGRSDRAELVGFDLFTDIAVLKIDPGAGLIPIRRATGERPERGDRAFAFGSPFGFKFSMSEGIVSGVGRAARSGLEFGGYSNYIQTDAAVNPGNSGGPLVDFRGRLIGMNVAIATARESDGTMDGQSAGISFAIPLGTIESVVEQLIEQGRVERGFLGISFRAGGFWIDEETNTRQTGVRVGDVTPGGAAEEAGIETGDVITHMNGEAVSNAEVLRSVVSSTRPGREIAVRVSRGSRMLDMTVRPRAAPIDVLFSQSWPALPREVGVIFAPGEGPLTITEIVPGSPGERAGLKVGEVVTEVDGERVREFSDFYRALVARGILEGARVPMRVRGEGDAEETRRAEITLRRGG